MNASDEYADELGSKEEAAKRNGPYPADNVTEREKEKKREIERGLKREILKTTEGKTKP